LKKKKKPVQIYVFHRPSFCAAYDSCESEFELSDVKFWSWQTQKQKQIQIAEWKNRPIFKPWIATARTNRSLKWKFEYLVVSPTNLQVCKLKTESNNKYQLTSSHFEWTIWKVLLVSYQRNYL
jgi:hypothetical protein